MFILRSSDGLYFSKKNKIILFETEQSAMAFAQQFLVYAAARAQAEGNIGLVFQLQMSPPLFVYEKYDERNLPKENTILFSELER